MPHPKLTGFASPRMGILILGWSGRPTVSRFSDRGRISTFAWRLLRTNRRSRAPLRPGGRIHAFHDSVNNSRQAVSKFIRIDDLPLCDGIRHLQCISRNDIAASFFSVPVLLANIASIPDTSTGMKEMPRSNGLRKFTISYLQSNRSRLSSPSTARLSFVS